MGNQNDCRIGLALQFFQQMEDLGLDGYIQGGRGLVGN
jgi:hypothetical protein